MTFLLINSRYSNIKKVSMLDIPKASAFSKSIPGDSSSHVFLKILNVANDLPGDLLQNLSLWLAISTFSLKKKNRLQENAI